MRSVSAAFGSSSSRASSIASARQPVEEATDPNCNVLSMVEGAVGRQLSMMALVLAQRPSSHSISLKRHMEGTWVQQRHCQLLPAPLMAAAACGGGALPEKRELHPGLDNHRAG